MTEPCTVLIIDDEEDEILLTKRILSRIDPDLTVESVTSGAEGFARLRDARMLPQLTLLDMKMAGVDGVELLRRIRADERLKHLRVAIVTNSELDSDRDQAMDAGADAFLHKAFDMGQFSSDIRMLLQQLSKK